MMQIWFLFKILETVFGTMCMVFHTIGFLDKEAIEHNMLYCGTFFGFALFSFIGVLNIAVGGSPPALVECATNFCAAIMYISASVVSMRNAEKDFHLMYLSDFEEPLHPFFAHCRSQSIAALLTGCVHLLHCILAFDVLFIPKRYSLTEGSDSETEEEDDEETTSDETRPIRMYFLGKLIEKKLRKNQWFDNMCRRPPASLVIFSIMPRRPSTRASRASRRHSNIFDLEKFSTESRKNVMDETKAKEVNEKGDRGTATSEEMKSKLDYDDYYLNTPTSNVSKQSDKSKADEEQGKRVLLKEKEAESSRTNFSETKSDLRPILRKEHKEQEPTEAEGRDLPRTSSNEDIYAILRKKSLPEEKSSTSLVSFKEKQQPEKFEREEKPKAESPPLPEVEPHHARFQPERFERVQELRQEPVVEPEPIVEPEPVIKQEPSIIKQEPSIIKLEPETQPEPVWQPEPVRKPEPIKESEKLSEPEPIKQPEPVWEPEPIRQPEPVLEPEPIKQPEPVTPPRPVISSETLPEPGSVVTPERLIKPEPTTKSDAGSQTVPFLRSELVLTIEPILQLPTQRPPPSSPRQASPPRHVTSSVPPSTSDMEPSSIPRLVKIKKNTPKADSSTQTEEDDQWKRLSSGSNPTVHDQRRRWSPPKPEKRKAHTAAQTSPLRKSSEDVLSIETIELPTSSGKVFSKPPASDLGPISEIHTEEDDKLSTVSQYRTPTASFMDEDKQSKPESPPTAD